MNKIYVTFQPGGMRKGDVMGYALAEDGTVVASHLCSDEGYVYHDMGMGISGWKHENYNEKYPDGWELVWVGELESALVNDKEFEKVFELNQSNRKEQS